MKLSTKLIVLLCVSSIIVVGILLTSVTSILLSNQNSNLKLFNNEFLESGLEQHERSSIYFFKLLDLYLTSNAPPDITQILSFIKELDNNKGNVIVTDYSGNLLLDNYTNKEIQVLVNPAIIDQKISHMLLTGIPRFELDNYTYLLNNIESEIKPIRAHFKIYPAQKIIIGLGNVFHSSKVRIAYFRSENKKSTRFFLVIGSLIILVGMVFFLILIVLFNEQHIIRPLKKVLHGLSHVASGDTKVQIELKTRDEMEALAHAFNEMTQKLDYSFSELNKEVEERKKSEKNIDIIFKTTVGMIGQESLNNIVLNITEIFNTECVIIGELVGSDTIHTTSMILDGKFVDEYSYKLPGTPCNNVLEKGLCYYEENVCDLFPDDKELISMNADGYIGIPLRNKVGIILGILCAISRKRLILPKNWEKIFRIIADKASAEIERKKANEAVNKSLNEKEVLLKEIHHRLKNNLMVILSLLKHQKITIEDAKTIEFFNKIESRIFSIALVHKILYASHDLSKINFKTYVTNLLDYIAETNEVNKNIFDISIESDDIEFDIDRVKTLGLIINELITNSLKYAFINIENKKIRICLDHNDCNYFLTIHDNGIGLPEHIDSSKNILSGLYLVTVLCEEINGVISFENDNGTKSTLSFPIN